MQRWCSASTTARSTSKKYIYIDPEFGGAWMTCLASKELKKFGTFKHRHIL